jgi:nucleotide-binding universal stress UspA family protein
MKRDVDLQLKTFAAQYVDDSVVYKTHVAEGKPYTTIIDYAEKLGADLIVMPSHKRSKIDKVVLGSVASKVVHNSPVNVLVVKPQG